MLISFIIPKVWAEAEVAVLLTDIARYDATVKSSGRCAIEGDSSIEELLVSGEGIDQSTEMYLRLKYNVVGIWKQTKALPDDMPKEVQRIIARTLITR